MQEIKYLNNKPVRGYDDGSPAEFMVGFIPHKSGTYRIEIDDTLHSVSQFSTAIQVLENAKEDDEVVIYLQTCGGSVHAGEAFIHALRKCAAPVHMVATGGVHSMGTQILLEADSIELSYGFNACIHCGSDGAGGNVNEYVTKAKFDIGFRDKQFREAYEGFLSEKELDAMLDGKDIWLDAEGWMKRALVRNEYFRNKMEAMIEAEDAAIIDEIEAAEQDNKPAKKPRKSRVKAVDTSPEL